MVNELSKDDDYHQPRIVGNVLPELESHVRMCL